MSRGSPGVDVELEDAQPDDELLADFIEAVDAAVPPSQAALEEVSVLLERIRPSVTRALKQRRAMRVFHGIREKYPTLKITEVAGLAARRTGVAAGTLRWWAWVEANSGAGDTGR